MLCLDWLLELHILHWYFLLLYIVLCQVFFLTKVLILTQEFEVLTKPIDVHMIREKLAMFLVAQVIHKKGEFYHPS